MSLFRIPSALLLLILFAGIVYSLDTIGTINGKTFFCNPNEPVQAATALTRCQESNATAARIDSEEEARLIYMYMRSNDVTYFWLDGSDYGDESNWRWLSTGQPFTYAEWGDGEPSINPSNNCMFMDQNGWFYTYRCTSPGGDGAYHTRYVCQTAAANVTTV